MHLNGHIAAPLSSYDSWSTPSPVALPDAVGYKVGPYLNGVKAPTSRAFNPSYSLKCPFIGVITPFITGSGTHLVLLRKV